MPSPAAAADARAWRASLGADPVVVAYGAGLDSTAMLVGLRDRRVVPDLILFADTGSEKPDTLAFLDVIAPRTASRPWSGSSAAARGRATRPCTGSACASACCRRSPTAATRAA